MESPAAIPGKAPARASAAARVGANPSRPSAQLAQSVVASGYNVIIDAAFLERRQRDQFRELAARLGVPMRILHCRAAADVLSQRVRQRRLAGRDISEADLRVLAHQLATYRELGDDERDDTVTVDTQAAHTAKAVLELLQRSL